MAKSVVLSLILALLLPVPAFADEPTDREEIEVPPPPAPRAAPAEVVVIEEEPVSAAPPPFVELERSSLAAGLGIQWGRGVLFFEGERLAFRIQGVSVGDIGASRLTALGDVENLARPGDLAGTYVAMEAAAAVGVGRSVMTMRNEKGVVIALRSEMRGGQLTLGAEGIRITLED